MSEHSGGLEGRVGIEWLRGFGGLCHACHGNGTTFASWNRDTGIKYRHCTRCNGTGNAPEVSHG